jgi:large subunit ribosomal protein L1
VAAVHPSKPAHTKGIYLRKVSVSSTMGVGVRIDQATLVG